MKKILLIVTIFVLVVNVLSIDMANIFTYKVNKTFLLNIFLCVLILFDFYKNK